MADVFEALLGSVPPDQQALIEGLRRRNAYGQLAAASGIGPLAKIGAADVAAARGEAETISEGRRTDANRAEERKFREWIQNQAGESRGLDRAMRAEQAREAAAMRRELAAQASSDKRYAADLSYQARMAAIKDNAGKAPAVTAQDAAVGFLENSGYDPKTGEDDITRLLNKAAGGIVKRGLNEAARAFDITTPTMEAGAALKSRASEAVLDFLGGRLGAGVSNADREFMLQRAGDIGNENLSVDERRAAWLDVRKRMERAAGQAPTSAMAPSLPVQAPSGLSPAEQAELEALRKRFGR